MRIDIAVSVGLASLALAACGDSSSPTATRASDSTASGGSKTVTVTRTADGTSSSGGVPLASAGGTSASGGAPPCRAGDLGLSFLGRQGATGHGELGFALRNTGGSDCSTIGYPGIQFLGRAGDPLPTLPTHTTHDFFGFSPLRALIVGAGQTVSFRLGVTHGIGSSAGCTTAYALQVIAPNDTASLRVTIPGAGAAECGTATVSPLRPGASAYP